MILVIEVIEVKLLLIGSTGLLGQNVKKVFTQKGFSIIGVAKKNADFNFDITDTQLLKKCFEAVKPNVVINAAAIVSLDYCEKNPIDAYKINTRVVADLVKCCAAIGAYYIQISTDHYYLQEGANKHKETDEIHLINEYARTKYLGECLANTYKNSLIIRTNIVGVRGQLAEPTFFEWAMDCLENKKHMVLFEDFYTSSLDAKQLAETIVKFVQVQPKGILNVASSEVRSKKEFILGIAQRAGFSKVDYEIGSIKTLSGAKRAGALGLDVSKTEKILGYRLPGFTEVIDSLLKEYKRGMQ